MNNNQKGFGTVVVLAFVIVGLMVLTGWYFWQKSSETKNTGDKTTTTDVANKQNQAEADPTSGWQLFTSEEGKFSLRYPDEWVTASNIEYCEKDTILLGTTADNAGKCQSDAPVLVTVARSASSPEEWLDFSKTGQRDSYTDITKTEVMVGGVTGAKVQGVYVRTNDDSGLGPRAGAKIINYYFLKDGYTYYATYIQNPTDPDVADNFNLMIMKTLGFD